jgi:hypothetical protein
VYKIRLEAHDWSNIETGLLKDELKKLSYMLCFINQSIKVYYHLVDHSHSRNRVTI